MNCLPLAFFSGGLGPGELALVFLVILVVFGPRRLPEVARMLGRMMQELRHASQEFRDQIMNIEEEAAGGDEPSADPLEVEAVEEEPVPDEADEQPGGERP